MLVTVGLDGIKHRLTKLDAQLDMAGFSGVYNEDRISLRAAWSTVCWKAGVVGPLVPVHGDGVCLVELVGFPGFADDGAFCGVVGWLFGMADSSRRRRLQQSAGKRLIETSPVARRGPVRQCQSCII